MAVGNDFFVVKMQGELLLQTEINALSVDIMRKKLVFAEYLFKFGTVVHVCGQHIPEVAERIIFPEGFPALHKLGIVITEETQ